MADGCSKALFSGEINHTVEERPPFGFLLHQGGIIVDIVAAAREVRLPKLPISETSVQFQSKTALLFAHFGQFSELRPIESSEVW